MFTGLIQALGTIEPMGEGYLQISCLNDHVNLIFQDLAIGDSVAVDGICLTAVKILSQGFLAAASPETLGRTTLGQPDRENIYVNLETSLRVGSKLGGHFVTGHIDGIGCLKDSVITANSWEMTFTSPETLVSSWQEKIAPYIVPKGSIAVNGVSLTVAECDRAGNWFKVAVIPHSFAETNLKYLKSGSLVNIEADILGKYVSKFVSHGFNNSTTFKEWEINNSPANYQQLEDISTDFLAENGYL